MAEQISFKERVRQALISNSRQYKYYFTDYEYLLCSDAFKKNPYYIVTAEEDNYLHLTGVLSHVSAQVFFDKCFNATLSDADFEVAGTHNGQDLKGTIRRKINVIPNIFGIFSASTTVQEDFTRTGSPALLRREISPVRWVSPVQRQRILKRCSKEMNWILIKVQIL